MTNTKNFDPSLLGIDKISFKGTDDVIYDIKYITMEILDNENIDSANSLYLIFNNVDGYIECNYTEESNGNKYLIFASKVKNKEVLKRYTEFWNENKNQIDTDTISCNKSIDYKKDFMKIMFESDDDLPLGKKLSIPVCIIVVRSLFQEDNN